MNEQNNNPRNTESQTGQHNTGEGSLPPGADQHNGHDDHGHHGHDHGHGHHHHDDPLHPNIGAPLEEHDLDPANRSLADALRLSFAVLKVVMILLVIALLFSGTRNVQEGQVAVRTLFGAVAGDPGKQILEPGGPYLWPPEPIGRFIRVRTSQRTVSVDEAFWFHVRPDQQGQPLDQLQASETLVPGRDGSLLTGDKNIVHGKWSVNYRIAKQDTPRFVRNVGTVGSTEEMWQRADRLVRYAAEQAILHTVAGVSADDYVRSNINRLRIRRQIQQRLRELNTGITVEQVLLNQPTPPLAVRDAFQAVSEAEAEKATKIDQARQYASRVLNETAGSAHDGLSQAIDAYERARRNGNQKAIDKADARIAELLDVDAAQGKVSEILRNAQLYRRSIVSTVRAEADHFQSLMPEYQNNPRIVLDRLWQDARQEILAGEVETFYLPSNGNKELRLQINRDPRIQDRRERQRFIQQQQQQQREAEQRRAIAPSEPGGP